LNSKQWILYREVAPFLYEIDSRLSIL